MLREGVAWFGDKCGPDIITVKGNKYAAITNREVWYAPVPNAYDTVDIFKSNSGFSMGRNIIDVFSFLFENLLDENYLYSNCYKNNYLKPNPCGPNLFEKFAELNAFTLLKQWNIDIAIHGSVLKPITDNSCDPLWNAARIKRAISNVVSKGGEVKYFSMDEPILGGSPNPPEGGDNHNCGYSVGEIADRVKIFISSIQVSYPNVMVGDMEAYPYSSVDELKNWVLVLESKGVHLPFLHLDFDLATAKEKQAKGQLNIQSDLAELKSFLESKNIAFGILFHPEGSHLSQLTSNQKVYDRIMDHINTAKQSIGVPSHFVFMSWIYFWGEDGKPHIDNTGKPLPSVNLPEDNSGSQYSFLYTMIEGWKKLNQGLNKAQFIKQVVPDSVSPGQLFNVSLTFKNAGETIWSNQGAGHHLGSSNAALWNVGRIFLGDNEIVLPGQEKTFTFQVKAPTTPGKYNFQWRMVQERVEWFGGASQIKQIRVE